VSLDPAAEIQHELDSTDRWSAAISYLSLICWLPYFLAGKRSFVLYHAKQGVCLFLVQVVAALGLWVLDVTLGRIPFLGLLILILARLAIYLPILALVVLGFTRALSCETMPLPWIGHMAAGLPDPPTFRSGGGGKRVNEEHNHTEGPDSQGGA
jgi:uncharacterized membrane protein